MKANWFRPGFPTFWVGPYHILQEDVPEWLLENIYTTVAQAPIKELSLEPDEALQLGPFLAAHCFHQVRGPL